MDVSTWPLYYNNSRHTPIGPAFPLDKFAVESVENEVVTCYGGSNYSPHMMGFGELFHIEFNLEEKIDYLKFITLLLHKL